MKIREVDIEKDLETIAKWFENRKWPQPSVEGIGPSLGLICELGDIPIACCFIYLTSRSIAFIEWCGTNPNVTQNIATAAFGALLDHIKQMAAVSKPEIKALSLVTKNKMFASHLESNGFKREDGFIRMLWTSK